MTLEQEIQKAINRHSAESGSNTPDFILAQFLMKCLTAFDAATQQREDWYGTRLYPGKGAGVDAPLS